MASLRERIVETATAALGGAGKPAGSTVHRSRTRPIDKDQLPAFAIYLVGETAAHEDTVPRASRSLTLRVECRAQGDPPDQALDPLLTWAVKSITTYAPLLALVSDIQEQQTQWQAASANKVYGLAAVDFQVTYFTLETDPEVAG